jgi:hypothetical protein
MFSWRLNKCVGAACVESVGRSGPKRASGQITGVGSGLD